MKEYKSDLSEYGLQDAKEKLKSARMLFEEGQYKDSVSRSYYAMFSAARALLATKGLNSSKHSGAISLFNLHFVKTDIVSEDCGKLLSMAKDIREDSNYGDFVVISKEEAEKQI